ncbi:prevent-host-death protein [Youngiibacter fragilis]|uniref:Prevent-host-death protein n=1 Tax=Youngiibacter fragilis 232.1 TaxID=994573 RepID=V7I0W5_9CLOT|nr:prevent-host-death protein [Youngiibacter fragilis]ETA78931.1 prevent-host-death protein [Youngiibacter fragilis 232.1]
MSKLTKGSTAYIEPVSISLFNQGKANKIFDDVKTEGIKAVLKNNKRIAMIVSPSKYDEMTEIIEDCRLLLVAMNRMKANDKEAIPMSDVMKRLGITQEDLDNTDAAIET